uniref:Uncharacterized protein n=1 Tax=Cucumis melo TaxID=3656 RepID=A0A9I9CV55_CUCME
MFQVNPDFLYYLHGRHRATLQYDVGRDIFLLHNIKFKIDKANARISNANEELRLVETNSSATKNMTATKLKIPEPKTFNGSRKAKELENFLWDIEKYFKAAHIPKQGREGMASIYLYGHTKL